MWAEQSVSLYGPVHSIVLLPWARKLIMELWQSKHFELFKSLLNPPYIYQWKKWIRGWHVFPSALPPTCLFLQTWQTLHANHQHSAFQGNGNFSNSLLKHASQWMLLLAVLGLRLRCWIKDCFVVCSSQSVERSSKRHGEGFCAPRRAHPVEQDLSKGGIHVGGLWRGDGSPLHTNPRRKAHNQYPAVCLQCQ